MPRTSRVAPGGYVYHVLNRGVGRRRLFDKAADFQAFEDILAETCRLLPMRVCGFCLMPNHWRLFLSPREDPDLSEFTGWVTLTHTQRWHANRHSAGTGHLFQGRFKTFPVQGDEQYDMVCRYLSGMHCGRIWLP